jgi:hypothetical protein
MEITCNMLLENVPKKPKLLGLTTLNWGVEDNNKAGSENFRSVSSETLTANRNQHQVVVDAFTETEMANYFNNFESFFEVTKEKRKVEPVRLSINPVNSVCRFTKDSILVNGIHEKQEGSFEVDLATLAVKQQVNKHVVSDMVVVSNYLVVAAAKPKTAEGSQGSQILIYSVDSEKQSQPIHTAKLASQSIFYENFFPKTRIFAHTNRSPNIAYIGQGETLVIMSIRGSKVYEYSPLHIPNLNHISMVRSIVRCLTSDGLIHSVVMQEGSFSQRTAIKVQLDPPANGKRFFTSIGSNSRYSVVSSINKDLKTLELYLLLNGKAALVDHRHYTEEKKIFPINQIQLLQKGAFTNVITTELYERFSFYVVKQNRLIPLNERERFTMELIYGINFYDKHKEIITVIYGNSFFKKVSL